MKYMIGFLTTILLFGSLKASAQPSAFLLISPTRPAHCELENHSLVNAIYDLKKISEDSTTATFQFKIAFGACQNKVFYSFPIEADSAAIKATAVTPNAPKIQFQLSNEDDVTLVATLALPTQEFYATTLNKILYSLSFDPDTELQYDFMWNLEAVKGVRSTDIQFNSKQN